MMHVVVLAAFVVVVLCVVVALGAIIGESRARRRDRGGPLY